jgi:hypothetical protein
VSKYSIWQELNFSKWNQNTLASTKSVILEVWNWSTRRCKPSWRIVQELDEDAPPYWMALVGQGPKTSMTFQPAQLVEAVNDLSACRASWALLAWSYQFALVFFSHNKTVSATQNHQSNHETISSIHSCACFFLHENQPNHDHLAVVSDFKFSCHA